MDVTPSVPVADSSPALPVLSLPDTVEAPLPAPTVVDRIEPPIVSEPAPAAATLSVSEPVPEAASSVVTEPVSAAATVVVDSEERLDAPAEPKPRRERPIERADNVPRFRSASLSGVSSRKGRTPSPVVTCVPPYKSTSKPKKLQRASQRAAVDSRQVLAADRRRQRPAAHSQPEASVSSAESKRDEKVRQLKVLLTQTDPVVTSGTAMAVTSSVSPGQVAGKRKSDDSLCRRIRPHSQDSGSDPPAGAGPATAAPSGATLAMETEVVPPPVFSSAKCDWAADVEVDEGTGSDGQDEVTWAAVALGASPARARRVSDPEVPADAVAMDVTPSVPVADSSPALPVLSLPDTVEAPLPAPTVVDRIEPPIVSEPAPAAATLSVSEPVPEAASSVVTEPVSAAATVVVDSEERLDAPAEPKPRRERQIERADNVPRFRSASLSGVSSRKGRTPSPVVTCVPPYKSTSKPKKLQRASQRAAVDSRPVLAADRRRQRPAAHSQPEASVSSAESKRDEKVRQLKVLLTQTDPVVTSGTAMAVTSSVSPGQVAGKRKSDDSHCRRIRPHSQDSGSDPPAGAGPATAAPSGAALAMETEVVPPPVFSSAKCDWAADVEVDEGTGSDGQDEVTWAAVALGASPARARRVSDPEVPADAVAMDVTPSVPVADSSPALPVLSLPDTVEAPLPAPTVVERIEPPIVSEPAPAAATLSVSEPVPEDASSVVTETVSAAATVVVDSEERLDAPAEPQPRRERQIERADNVPRFRSASLSGVSSRKGRTPSPVVTCVPPYKSTSKPKKLQRASQRAAVDSRPVLAADRRRQRPAAHSQPEASVSSAESKRDEKVRQLKVLLTQTDPVVTSGTAMAVTSSVSPGQVAGKRKSDDSHCRRIRPHSQDSGSDPPAGAGPATAAPSGAALAMETEVVPPPVFSSAKCDWAADVEVDEGTGSASVSEGELVIVPPAAVASDVPPVSNIDPVVIASPVVNIGSSTSVADDASVNEVSSFWYKVVNRLLPTNDKMNHIHLRPSSSCDSCPQEDTLEHRFTCARLKSDCPKRSRPVQLPRTDGQDEVTWAAVALGASPARASRVSVPEIADDVVAMDVTPPVLDADSSPALPVVSLPVHVAAPVLDPLAVDKLGLPIVSDPVPAAVTLSVSQPVPEAAPSVVNKNVSDVVTVVGDREERLDAPAEPKPRRERPTERAETVTRIRSASISGVSSRKARTPSPVVTCVPPYKSTSKQKKLQRASQRAVVDSRQASASDRRRQRPAACSQPAASVRSAESKRDEKVRQLKVLLTQTAPVVASDMAMDVVSSVSPAHLAGKRKSDDSHCRRVRPPSQESGSDSAAGAGPATAAPSGAAVSMGTEVVQPPVFLVKSVTGRRKWRWNTGLAPIGQEFGLKLFENGKKMRLSRDLSGEILLTALIKL
ncbi:nascent polypeptide-associated complex subunit alpha, muscle-specific form-like [Schistocerca nitens]|uniref:nascent polypeptide-associated complex subunit alpha, muscle-specific form-like n=1 Tax=Schistocerca nitens TaxID=7011 RepID=UPI002117A07E|nr:nascent polypeptide-associated complex subunit alpha, muscle-specific form-like [Schistocerca nitens]